MEKEKVIKKCFEVTYYQWFDVDHPNASYAHKDAYAEQVYAENHAQAKYQFLCSFDHLNLRRPSERKELWNKLKARRVKSMDWLRREPHPLLSSISESQLHKMKHAVGLEDESSYSHVFYRNRYVVPIDPEWDDLITKGLALKTKNTGLDLYYLSQEGKNVIISLMPIRRHHKQLAPQHAA